MSVDLHNAPPNDRNDISRAFFFTITAFLSALLLFLVEPMAAKRLLPSFGGTPAVWTVSMLFFQSVLLAGYLYAHSLTSRLATRTQVVVHLFLLCATVVGWRSIDLASEEPDLSTDWSTATALLRSLATSVGVPFLLLASTAPLLQSWFAGPRDRPSRDPYFLYVASNIGSLAALLLYPFAVERWLTLDAQFHRWRLGLDLLALAIVACGMITFSQTQPISAMPAVDSHRRVDRRTWTTWAFLAFIPSSLLLGVTSYLTTDLSSIPLLWVIPLALYLLTFIIAFSGGNPRATEIAVRAYPLVLVMLALSLGFGVVKAFLLPLHVVGFFLGAMVCHGELAARRPDPARLTSFYLAISVGGCLGGLFNGVVAPWLFRSIAEYPIALVLAALVVAFRTDPNRVSRPKRFDVLVPAGLGVLAALVCGNVAGLAESALGVAFTVLIAGFSFLIVIRRRSQPLRFALTVAALLAASHFSEGVNGKLMLVERSFFGVTRVTDVPDGPFHRMFHGSTLHGQQGLSPELRHQPLSYFTESGPIGDIFRARRDKGPIAKVAVAGLGAGSLLSYAKPGEDWTVFEIDPAIVRIASDPKYFTYVQDCQAQSLKLTVGDARLALAKQPSRQYSLIFLDAFSSDAIPMHLITREALAIYRQKAATDGWLIFNISNRYIDLLPVLGSLANDAGWVCRARVDASVTPAEKSFGKRASIWAIMAPTKPSLGAVGSDPRWFEPKAGSDVWTDGHADIFKHWRWRSVPTSP